MRRNEKVVIRAFDGKDDNATWISDCKETELLGINDSVTGQL